MCLEVMSSFITENNIQNVTNLVQDMNNYLKLNKILKIPTG